MIKKFIRDITGATAREEKKREEEAARLELVRKANEAMKKEKAESKRKAKEEKLRKQAEEEAKLTPKELATKKGEPWVDVIEFKVDDNNIMHGFFELDWNDLFVVKLKSEGYGVDGDPEEEIVARWYRDICMYAAAQEGIDMSQADSGYLNVRKIGNNKSEIG